jgi:hypothetical protein
MRDIGDQQKRSRQSVLEARQCTACGHWFSGHWFSCRNGYRSPLCFRCEEGRGPLLDQKEDQKDPV